MDSEAQREADRILEEQKRMAAEERRKADERMVIKEAAKMKQNEERVKSELENELTDRWREKTQEIFQFRALLSSRSNIYVHGPNGSGKTSFVLDCVKV
jgi:DNA replication protein DnaC